MTEIKEECQRDEKTISADDIEIPESFLKKRARDEKQQKIKKAKRENAIKKRAEKKDIIFKRAEAYVKEYLMEEADLKNLRKQASVNKDFFVEPEEKILFVFRIRGINGMSPKTRTILRLLRLPQINNGVFFRNNKNIQSMIRLVEPYVAYGYPDLELVRELIYKRGHAKIARRRVAITDNEMVEKALGQKGIICVEDLVHEIYTSGKHFRAATNFLWPFKLSNPKGGFRMKKRHFVEEGDYGNRGRLIGEIVRRML